MLQNLTYKKKLRLMLFGAGIMIFIIYFLALDKTLDRRKSCRDLQDNLALVENAPSQMAEIQAELKRIENIIGKETGSVEDFRQLILEKTSLFCETNRINIKEIPESIITERKDFEIHTHKLILEGGFIKLLTYLYEAEQNWMLSNIASARFYSAKEIRTKRNKLYLEVYIQSIKKKN